MAQSQSASYHMAEQIKHTDGRSEMLYWGSTKPPNELDNRYSLDKQLDKACALDKEPDELCVLVEELDKSCSLPREPHKPSALVKEPVKPSALVQEPVKPCSPGLGSPPVSGFPSEDVRTANLKSSSRSDQVIDKSQWGTRNGLHHHQSYLGLRNEGSTCYLNSILQCLFMAPEFTNEILRSLSKTEDSTTGPVYVFQNLFLELQYGRSPPSTLKLMRCFGIQEGRQQDVEEHFRLLINNLPEDIQQLFRIQMVHSLKCKRCENKELMQNPMLCLPLAIKDPEPSVGRALLEFHENNILDLDNQCYCSICKHKEDAISRHYFTDLPKILVVHLKRYEIYEGRFKKISCPVSVPSLLTVSVEKPQEAAAKDKRQEVNRTGLEEAAQHQKYKDKDSVTYTLFALCNHYGGLRGGHYTAEIKSFDDNHWYTFNDKQVKAMRSRSNEKDIHSDTAYLLMYYQEQETPPKFLEKEALPSAIQRRIDETPMDSYTPYRMHSV